MLPIQNPAYIYLFVYLSACLSIFAHFSNRLSGSSPVHLSSVKVRARTAEESTCYGRQNFEASSLLGRGVFGKLQLISVRISVLFML